MNVTMEIPDDVACKLSADGSDLSRRALECWVAEEYRHERINKTELRRLLGLGQYHDVEPFLKEHKVWLDYTIADLERDCATLARLGI